MANVAVIGAQWGDEGKGKIVDWLSARADVVVRFQGGHNAGHTLVIDGVTFKLSLLPSGVVRQGKLAVIGNGVVVDPWALAGEIEKLKGQGVMVTPANLIVAENATLILPFTANSTWRAKAPIPCRPWVPPSAASVRLMKTRSAAAPFAPSICGT